VKVAYFLPPDDTSGAELSAALLPILRGLVDLVTFPPALPRDVTLLGSADVVLYNGMPSPAVVPIMREFPGIVILHDDDIQRLTDTVKNDPSPLEILRAMYGVISHSEESNGFFREWHVAPVCVLAHNKVDPEAYSKSLMQAIANINYSKPVRTLTDQFSSLLVELGDDDILHDILVGQLTLFSAAPSSINTSQLFARDAFEDRITFNVNSTGFIATANDAARLRMVSNSRGLRMGTRFMRVPVLYRTIRAIYHKLRQLVQAFSG
jgi:hypothetical protein